MAIAARTPAPPFTLVADDGSEISSSDLVGKPTVLYFYPYPNEDDQYPFVEALPKLVALGANAFAISNELVTNEKLNKIPRANRLTDTSGAMLAAYDAMGLHRIYGQLLPGVLRSVVLIGANGNVIRRWPRAVLREHFAKVIDRVKRLAAKANPGTKAKPRGRPGKTGKTGTGKLK